MTERLKDLVRHMEWADAIVATAALHSEAARDDERIGRLLHHLHMVQHYFLRHWSGEAFSREEPVFPDLAAQARWAQANHETLGSAVGRMTADDLACNSVLPWAGMVEKRMGRTPDPSTLEDTVFQVVLHSTYHRGQANARLRELGVEPPLTDYIAWIWMGRPKPEWPEMASRGSHE